MAATNYTPIQLYYSSTASAAPTAGNLASGELAINITDGKLYYKDNGGVVQVIATKGAGTIGGTTTQIQYNNAGALAGSASMTFNNGTNVTTLTTLNLTNALGAIYGGTAQSAYTQGDVLYASATNTLSKLGIGTVNYILTSTGSVPQWVAPSSVTVQTANNLAGGAGGSVPYQSAADTTTFLAIGAANRVLTSSGTVPQWVTALTGLTGVSSSSITNTSLTSTRLVYSSTAGLQADSANLTFDGTTLSATGFSTTGLSTLVKTVKIGDSNFSGTAVFAAATPAKLYIGTGTVTDTTSAIGATNAVGAVSSLAITPIAASNTSVTYTNASTLYIAGAPSAGTNITITNPYSLYVAAGAAYFGGAVTFAGSASLAGLTVTSLTDSGLTSGRVTYAGTGGLLTDSANLTFSGTALAVTGSISATAGITASNGAAGSSIALLTIGTANNTVGGSGNQLLFNYGSNASSRSWRLVNDSSAFGDLCILQSTTQTGSTYSAIAQFTSTGLAVTGTLSSTSDATINSLTVGRGAGAVSTNTAVGASALSSNITGSDVTAVGYRAYRLGTAVNNTAFGSNALGNAIVTGAENTSIGRASLYVNTSGANNVAVGSLALFSNDIASNSTAVGYQAGYTNTGAQNTYIGSNSAPNATSGSNNTALGYNSGLYTRNGSSNTALGANTLGVTGAGYMSGDYNTAVGSSALYSQLGASNNTAVGYQAGYSNIYVSNQTFLGYQAGYSRSTGNDNYSTVMVGNLAGYSTSTGTDNTYVGGYAGRFQTGSLNTAIGGGALYGASGTSVANANTAVGYSAGNVNTTGSEGTFLGHLAGQANTTGVQNTVIGSYAFGRNQTGSYNVAVGRSSLGGNAASNYSADYNTAVGTAALSLNQTGASNTAVGFQALNGNTSASNNTAVGYQAGYSGAAGSANNTFVGYAAGYGTITNGSNTFIGHNAGYYITTGYYNTILGSYNGNQSNLDIRTLSNYVVLADGAGNLKGVFSDTGNFSVGAAGAGLLDNNAFWTSPVSGSSYFGQNHATGTASGTNFAYFGYAGSTIGSISQSGTTAVLFNVMSDQRLKENIQDAESASALIDSLQVRQFDWKTDNTHQRYGFVAQELVTVAPEAVHQPNDPEEMMAVDYSKLVPMLVKEIQSLRKRLAVAGIA